MRYRNIIIALGFVTLLAASPILGMPLGWRLGIIILANIAVVVLAYLAGKERRADVVTDVAVVQPEAPAQETLTQ